MKKITALIILAALTVPFSGGAGDGHYKAAVELCLLLKVDKHCEKITETVYKTVMANIAASYPDHLRELSDAVMKWSEKYMSWDALRDVFAWNYVEAFSEEEMKELIKFYKSPVGKKMALKHPELLEKSGQMASQIAQDNMAELQGEIEKAVGK